MDTRHGLALPRHSCSLLACCPQRRRCDDLGDHRGLHVWHRRLHTKRRRCKAVSFHSGWLSIRNAVDHRCLCSLDRGPYRGRIGQFGHKQLQMGSAVQWALHLRRFSNSMCACRLHCSQAIRLIEEYNLAGLKEGNGATRRREKQTLLFTLWVVSIVRSFEEGDDHLTEICTALRHL